MKPPFYVLALTGVILCSCVGFTHQQIIQTGLKDATFRLLDTAYLNVVIDSSVTDSGQWFKNTRLLDSTDKPQQYQSPGYRQLAIFNFDETDAGLYNFTIRGESTTAVLRVRDEGLRIVIGLQAITVPVNGVIYLETRLSRSGVATGTWTKNGNAVTSGTASVNGTVHSLTITNAQSSDSGQYMYTVGGLQTASFVTVETAGPIPVNGGWSEWSQYIIRTNDCPVTCGTTDMGRQSRNRTCNNPAPQNGGLTCSGPSEETRQVQCGPAQCPINGAWSDWGNWGAVRNCAQSCGTQVQGARQRFRECSNPRPQNGGRQCSGSQRQTKSDFCTSVPVSCVASIFSTRLQNTTRAEGDQMVFTVIVAPDQTGSNGTWFKDGVPVSNSPTRTMTGGGTAFYLIIYTLAPTDAGQYSFTANGETTSAYLTVTGSTNPVNGGWSSWNQWIRNCPVTCGTSGTESRTRTCTNPAPQNGGLTCSGSSSETQSVQCGPAQCPINGTWADWDNWGVVTNCAKTCGTQVRGTRQRFRTCTNPSPQNGGLPCSGSRQDTESAFCTSLPACLGPVNGDWSEWFNWGSVTNCSGTCGQRVPGTRQRYRTCTNPPPQNGGLPCSGPQTATESAFCTSLPACTVFAAKLQDTTQAVGTQLIFTVELTQSGLNGTWYRNGNSLSGSSRLMISQTQRQHFLVIYSLMTSDMGQYSFQVNGETTSAYLTVTGTNPVNGGWSSWNQWIRNCPVTCGTSGTESRTRTCTNPAPQNGGLTCSGSSSETQSVQCGPAQCPINGTWADWDNWGVVTNCAKTCGTQVRGTRQRFRTCTNPSPQNGGLPCSGSRQDTESAFCTSLPACLGPVNGGWSEWYNWGSVTNCSGTCGPRVPGTRQRSRTCTNPPPQNGGLPCSGSQTESGSAFCTSLPACTGIFTQGLANTSQTIGRQVVLEIRLSQSGRTGIWTRNGVQIYRSSKYDIVVRGNNQILYINNFQMQDAGFYSFTVDGQTTSAWITAEPSDTGVSEWGEWTDDRCPVSCGAPQTTKSRRNRTCLTASGQCSVVLSQTRWSSCGDDPCPVHGGYSQWTNWSDPPCDVPCGTTAFKTVERTRECNNPRPSNNGNTCAGPKTVTETRYCRLEGCPVHGNVTSWSDWRNDTCSATCGAHATRSQYRSRTCTNPIPDNGGRFCTNHLYESIVKGCGYSDCKDFHPQCDAELALKKDKGTVALSTVPLFVSLVDVFDYFSRDRNGWIIGAIGAAVAVGVMLIILIVACCVWHCCKNGTKKRRNGDKLSSCEMDVLPPNKADYVTRGKYMDQNITTTSPEFVKYS